ncbi:DUF4328 domain-containing protein [Nocardioides sp.]|uniref:DUF4328 domain-containing protein n=1 Tax=Nocardioides sp. TaxID=35761 RepID=UPI002D119D00|nr:DUF4328 domain-containing protein [Nocardioides sp.]HXH77082.1 DUF4328 domain-containing protein [Nocardioides sp.]
MTQPYPNQVWIPPVSTRPPLGTDFFRLARVVQGLLVATALMHVAMIIADWYYLDLAQRLIDTPRRVPFEDLQRFDTVTLWTLVVYLTLLLLTGITFICWLFQAHRSDRTDPVALQHESYWAVIGWFIPIMGLFRPYQMVDDVRRGADRFGVTPVAQPYWWAAFLLGAFMEQVSGWLWPAGDEPGLRAFGEKLQSAAWAELSSNVVNIVAAVLAILVVRDLTATLRNAPPGGRVD